MVLGRQMVSMGLAALLAGAAGCTTGGPGGGGAQVAARPTGVEGEWLSSDGVAVSRLQAGAFTTSALDTGNKLADGSYKVAGRMVEITVVSKLRGTTTNVNCSLVAANQMNCTSSTNQQFVLTRRGTA